MSSAASTSAATMIGEIRQGSRRRARSGLAAPLTDVPGRGIHQANSDRKQPDPSHGPCPKAGHRTHRQHHTK